MELKERIINEALLMFSEMGIKSVRMDDIAVACGISKRTLYELFSGREEFVGECIRYHVEKHEQEVNTQIATAKNVIDEFWIMFEHGPEFMASTKMVILDLIKFYPKIFEEFMKGHHIKVIRENEERLKRGIEQGLFLKMIDPEFTALSLTRYLYGLHQDLANISIASRLNNNNPDPRSLQFAIMIFFRGITTEKGRKYIDENILKEIE